MSRAISAIRGSSNDVGGRVLEVSTMQYSVHGRGYVESVCDVENVAVKTDGEGTPVYVTSLILELTVYPAIFAVWKGRALPAIPSEEN